MTKRQPELMNEWDTRFYGTAQNVGGDVWWYDEPLGNGTVKRHPLIPIHPVADHRADDTNREVKQEKTT